MEYRKLNAETVEGYLTYLAKAIAEDPERMWVEAVDVDGIRQRVSDPFYQATTSILAVEDGRVLGRLEYHFYGCMQDGYRMAYVDWVYVLKEHRHRGIAQGLFREFEKCCCENRIDQYFLIRAENPDADRFYDAFQDAQLQDLPILRKNLGERIANSPFALLAY